MDNLVSCKVIFFELSLLDYKLRIKVLVMMSNKLFFGLLCSFFMTINLIAQQKVFPGADEKTPSKAQYFSWINNTNEGTTEGHTLINLEFFEWLQNEYGMQLDIYAFDAGAIDGKRFYGNVKSERFKKQFPNGFDPMFEKATKLGARLGIWGGPDGFGDTPEEEAERTELMVKLARDYNFALFKFDAVCGPLRPEKEDAFINMMEEVRKHSPDLILLNHRLGFEKAEEYATTFLWGGAETYVDVFMNNGVTAPHHRAGAISRGLPPNLQRLTEDHGVCISSCLDYWEDDLVLQAFNRSLILSPQIYGNPWLLRDDEFPKLARIFNLHKKYKNILINGKVLPETYGPNAVARGNEHTRIVTLRNLSWNEVSYTMNLGDELGLANSNREVSVLQVHPHDEYFGTYQFNEAVSVKVQPFRSAMFIVSTQSIDEPLIKGVPYQVVKNVDNASIEINLLGNPGEKAKIKLINSSLYKKAKIDGESNGRITSGKSTSVIFNGNKLELKPHRKLADLVQISVPNDAESYYEATTFAADNNALEVRSVVRSGKTNIPEVKAARDAFFKQDVFVKRGIWDRNLFDNDETTGFWQSKKYDIDQSVKGGALRIDLGKVTAIDELIIKAPNHFGLHPILLDEGNYVEVSKDLKEWRQVLYLAELESRIPINDDVRFLRFRRFPQQIVEVEGFFNGKLLDRSKWRASNLFAHSEVMKPIKAWSGKITLPELAKNSYLSVALNGKHGVEGAYVAAKIDGEYIGAPDRAVSFPSNTWEYINARRDKNYTYYIPMKSEYIDKNIEVVVLAYDKEHQNINPEVWISSFDAKEKVELILEHN